MYVDSGGENSFQCRYRSLSEIRCSTTLPCLHSRSPSASEVITAYTVPHTHTQRLIERRQSMRYTLPRVPTSIDFLTAVARGHRPWMIIIMQLLGIVASLCGSRSLSQHAASTDSLTLGPGPAMAAGFPQRNSPLCPTPPELAIRILADTDEVLEVVVMAHVVY
jgi:hypothetical protein